MQTILTNQSSWYLVADKPEPGLPARTAITPPFRIGRREGFDLCLGCRNISGLHAELLEEDGQLWLDDLNSTNGSFVNGIRIREKTMLQNGDSVQFGSMKFSVVSVSSRGQTATCVMDDNNADEVPESTEEKFQRLLREGVVPYFQPIFNITESERQKVGYEVLGRSRLFGLNTPDQMFAAATDFEMESLLSRVLRLRGMEAAESELPKDQLLFVNTHPAEIECDDIQVSMKEIRKKFPSRPIMLELPEQVLYIPETFADMCSTLKDLDVQLVLHDFGAGQIQLAELSELEPDVVKFDCALTQGVDKAGKKRQRLVSAMVKMATELGITPMAEYVETESEHETLKQLGFVLVQGFHYGHPASIESLENQKGEVSSIPEPATTVNRKLKMRPLQQLKGLTPPAPEAKPLKIQTADPNKKKAAKDSISKLKTSQEASENYEIHDADWLLKQNIDRYTVQLIFPSSAVETEQFVADAKKFISEQGQPGDYAVYKKRGLKREWFVLVYGVFDDRENAQAASAKFEGDGHSSFSRSLNSVKSEIRSLGTTR